MICNEPLPEVIQLLVSRYDAVADAREQFEEMAYNFRISGLYSIDAFLEARPQYADMGRLSIAAHLLSKERDAMTSTGISSDWYQWLFNQLRDVDPQRLRMDNLGFLTFNYDRTLEFALARMASVTFGGDYSPDDVPIIHLYGSLVGDMSLGYGRGGQMAKLVPIDYRNSANGITTISRESSLPDAFARARDWLAQAKLVVFVGFGFHSENMARLGFVLDEPNKLQSVYATACGLPLMTLNRAKRYFWNSQFGSPSERALEFLLNRLDLASNLEAARRY